MVGDDEGGIAGGRSPRLMVMGLVTCLALVVVVIAVVTLRSGHHARAAAAVAVTVPAPTTTVAPPVTTPALPAAPSGSTLVAAMDGAVPGSTTAGAPATTTVPADWYGYPSVLPVIDESAGWVRVRLAQRPNEGSAWVPMSQVSLSSDPYRIVIDLATEHLEVYRSGTKILSIPAGVGTPGDPTVTGQFFMTMRVPPPDPGYGPFVLVTSAHSDSITDWEGSGDAIIAIHGPIDATADAEIGTTGARISHGCVRLHDADLAQLNVIPAGTPIDITAGP